MKLWPLQYFYLFCNEDWVTKQKQKRKMEFLCKVKSCTKFDRICNEEMRNEIQIFSLNGKTQNYRHK